MDKKLSEAIREGAKIAPQTQNIFIRTNLKNEITSCCTLGAAALAINPEEAIYDAPEILEQYFGDLLIEVNNDGGYYFTELYNVITEMNDKEGKTREEIADWLEEQGL